MRLRDAIAIIASVSFLTSACSRLTFIKPSAKRHDYRQVAPDYRYADTDASRQRTAARNRVALAQERLRAGQFDQAAIEAKAALKIDPKSADAYTVLAVAADQSGRSGEAGSYYAKATELATVKGAMQNNYGAWLCAQGRAAESLAWFDRAIADPRYAQPADALANAGACALRAGQLGRVQRDLRRALALDPSNAVALEAMAGYQYRQANYLEARAFSERRLAAAPATAQVLQLASQIENKLGDTAAAARYAQRSRTEFPRTRTAQPGEITQP